MIVFYLVLGLMAGAGDGVTLFAGSSSLLSLPQAIISSGTMIKSILFIRSV